MVTTRGGDTYLTNVEWKNHGASYHGGDIDVVVPSLENKVVTSVNKLCSHLTTKSTLIMSVSCVGSWNLYETSCG